MAEERFDFYDDDYYDGAAVMTLRGRRERLEKIFDLETNGQEEN